MKDDLRRLPLALEPLIALPNWLIWRWEGAEEKPTKVPYQSKHPNIKASSTAPKTWSNFASAIASEKKADGIGFCLFETEIGAFDIDDCRDPTTREIDPWALKLVKKAASYTEITISGTGLRIIGRAAGPKIYCKQKVKAANGVTVEIYRKAERYIVMTGNALPEAPAVLADLDTIMDEVFAELDGSAKQHDRDYANAEFEDLKPDDPRLKKLDAKWIALGYRGEGIAVTYAGDRSRAVMAFACECFRADIAEDIIAACLMQWKIGDHIRDSSNVDRALKRTLVRARLFVEDLKLFEMNEQHCVLSIAGKTRVATWGDDPDFPGRKNVNFSSFGDFKALLDKYRHNFPGKDNKGNPVTVTMGLGSWWISNKHRLQYDGGMRFMPNRDEDVVNDTLNLWQGFSVAARKPEGKSGASGCRLLLDHGLKIICSGNEEHFDYLMKREALIAQKRIRSEIAVGLQTEEEGTGKETWCGSFRYLYGMHAMQVQNTEHVIGKHNAHLEVLLRLTADEALFAGDPRQRNALYNLITEPRLTIEPKFIGVYTASNYLNIDIISNAKHFIPVSGTARRFMVPTVSPDRANDHDYFSKIRAQLNEGGYEALLYHLLYEIDIRDFNVRDVPKTAGLLEQKLSSLDPEQGWWLDMLMNGELPGGCEDPDQCPATRLFESYIKHAQQMGVRRRSIETRLGIFLQQNVPGLKKIDGLYDVVTLQDGNGSTDRKGKRGNVYIFPPLVECRAAFART